MIHQRAHDSDGDDIRDGELLASLLLDRLEELLAELRSFVHIDLIVQDEGRSREVAIGHTLSDDATHHIHRYNLDFTCSSSGCRGSRCRSLS